MKKITLLFCLFISFQLISQEKRSLSHDDYDKWNRVTGISISNDGSLVSYQYLPNTGRGDSSIEIYNNNTSQNFRFKFGSSPSISFEGSFVFFKKNPAYQLTRSEKLKKVKKDEQTKGSLMIYDSKRNTIIDSISRISTFKTPKKYEGYVAAQCYKEVKDKKAYKELDSIGKLKADLTINNDFLVLADLIKKTKDTFYNVKQYEFAEKGKVLYYRKDTEKKKKTAGIFKVDLETKEVTTVDEGKEIYKNFSLNKDGNKVAFLSSQDSAKHEQPKFDLNYWNSQFLQTLVDSSYDKLKKKTILSQFRTPAFSDDGNRLYFYTQVKPRTFVKDTTVLDEELAEVDVWSWHDKMIQPEQKVRLKSLKEASFANYVDLNDLSVVELNNVETSTISFDSSKEDRYVISSDSRPYDIARSWDNPWRRDYYLVNTDNGSSTKLVTAGASSPTVDPTMQHVIYYDVDKKNWFVYDIEKKTHKNLTEKLNVEFYDVDDDHPMLPRAYGLGGFTTKNEALIYDKYDIWKFDLTGKYAPKNITKTGRSTKTTYRTVRLEEKRSEISYFGKNELLLTGYNEIKKTNGVFTLNLKNNKISAKLSNDAKNFRLAAKSKNNKQYLFTRMDFVEFPDIWITDADFDNPIKLSNANPQQKDFKWGSVELVKWKAYDGVELEGLLYKPDNFDPSKKYPMITYFYEKRSQGLHSYSVPTPSASIVNMPYLVSNGYLAFVPDIVYKDGHPGGSAFNCIVSGVEAIEKLGFVDSERMGLQGQSWGGYQTAHLVTRTDKFAAAMAGAPVANMTSAYGGIRWGSGLNRAFQYERTQSRIGKTLWDEGGLDLYIENSPLFFVDKINTPVLIMHNDNDGAVPWYQGIEFFMAIRRLQKPVWMLTYNKEAHNLRNVKNKQDLSIRMMQFFDHYLQGKKAPVWMTKGVPILDKKKHYGYELEE